MSRLAGFFLRLIYDEARPLIPQGQAALVLSKRATWTFASLAFSFLSLALAHEFVDGSSIKCVMIYRQRMRGGDIALENGKWVQRDGRGNVYGVHPRLPGTPSAASGVNAALHESAIGPLPTSAEDTACPQLAKADTEVTK